MPPYCEKCMRFHDVDWRCNGIVIRPAAPAVDAG